MILSPFDLPMLRFLAMFFFDILLRPGMHGGISPSLDSLDNIRQLDRIQEAGMKTTKISAVDG